MIGEEIRQARLRKGWTQATLASRVNRSQATISMIEGGRMVPPEPLLSRIWSVLAEHPEPPVNPGDPKVLPLVRSLPDLTSIRSLQGTSLPVRADVWRRPSESGDFTLCLSLSSDTFLVAALDVAGHGLSVLPAALYLQGWLRGWMQGLANPPRLQSLVEEFSRELSQAKIDAGGYFALLSRHRGASHTVSYEAVAYGFPPPLLITGPPFRTLASADLGPPLPAPGEDLSVQPVRVDRLSAPWRLVLASDGLLSRLGEGHEDKGRRFLSNWQTGPSRDERPERHLETGVPLTDDESFLLLQWDGWDRDQAFAITDNTERHRFLRVLLQEVEPAVGPKRAAAFLQAVAEALSNALIHGGAGAVTVRFRREEARWRVEVEDDGPDNVGDKEIGRLKSGFALMRRGAQSVDVRKGRDGGTIVALVLDEVPSAGPPEP